LNIQRLNSRASYDACTCNEAHLIIKNLDKHGLIPFLHTFFTGLKHRYNICCILFFLKGHNYFHYNMQEYCEQFMLTKENGKILCPECIVDQVCYNKTIDHIRIDTDTTK